MPCVGEVPASPETGGAVTQPLRIPPAHVDPHVDEVAPASRPGRSRGPTGWARRAGGVHREGPRGAGSTTVTCPRPRSAQGPVCRPGRRPGRRPSYRHPPDGRRHLGPGRCLPAVPKPRRRLDPHPRPAYRSRSRNRDIRGRRTGGARRAEGQVAVLWGSSRLGRPGRAPGWARVEPHSRPSSRLFAPRVVTVPQDVPKGASMQSDREGYGCRADTERRRDRPCA